MMCDLWWAVPTVRVSDVSDRRKAIGISIRRGAAWAMIPLAVLAGRPSTGCLCADGRHKEFCSGGTASGSGDAHKPQEQHACCCRAGMAACESSQHHEHDCRGGGRGKGVSQGGGCHCTPLFNVAGSVSKTAGKIAGPGLIAWQTPPNALGIHLVSVGALPLERTTGPPVDRVIVLRCLLI